MKKIEYRYETKCYKGCRFYLDDIEKILGLFQDRKYLIKITDKENEFESLNELKKEQGETPIDVEITGYNEKNSLEYIKIYSKKRTIHTYMNFASQDATKVIFAEIKKLCKSRKNKYYSSILLIVGLVMLLLSFISDKTKNDVFALVAIGLLPLGLFYEIYFKFRKPFILRKRHEGGFWKRNKDKILIAIITAVITAVITFLITKIF